MATNGGTGGIGMSGTGGGGYGGEPSGAGAGGGAGRTAVEELLARSGELCTLTCDRIPECGARTSVAACLEVCPATVAQTATLEACATLMLEAMACMAAPDCTDTLATCDRLVEEAMSCSGDGRWCWVAPIEPGVGRPAGQQSCGLTCIATLTQPEEAVECFATTEQQERCTCSLNGDSMPEVMATSCDEAYAICFR